jgi:hypothetical protein
VINILQPLEVGASDTTAIDEHVWRTDDTSFDWLKNIDHVAPGMMTKKYDEQSQIRILHLMGYKSFDE